MAILQVAAEDTDMNNASGLAVITTAGRFRSGYGRCALRMPETASSVIARSNAFPGGTVTACWLSCRFYGSFGSINNPRKIFGVGRSGTTNGIALAMEDGKLSLLEVTDGSTAGDTVVASESGFSVANAVLTKLDVSITNFNSASCVIDVYVNGRFVFTSTSDYRTGGISALDEIWLFSKGDTDAGSVNWDVSEIIAADEDTRRMSLVTLFPNAAGDNNDFSNSYTAVDETTLDEVDLVNSTVAGDESQYNLSAMPSGDRAVKHVKAAAWASRDATGIQTLELGVRTGGTTNLAAGVTLTTAFALYERHMADNPVTVAAWTVSELDALQIAIESDT